jgi:hypothetical protein
MAKESGSNTLDTLKWVFALAIFGLAVFGNSYFVEVAFFI